MVRKLTSYTVLATEGVAKEMVRYEGNSIISQEFVDCPFWCQDNDELKAAFSVYNFLITGTPNKFRWASFGISIFGQ